MYFLDNICSDGTLDPVLNIVGFIIKAIWIGIPIILIILGMLDLGKAVVANKDDEVKKATKAFGRRFLYAVGVFAVVWIVTSVFDLIAKTGEGALEGYDESSWKVCWTKIRE